jgi:DNA-binding FadR family transcriptional regulator
MRTTLTIDDDLHALLEQKARRERRSVRDVINDLLRGALVHQRPGEPFRVEVQHSALQPGIDPHRLNQLADELEDEALTERLRP